MNFNLIRAATQATLQMPAVFAHDFTFAQEPHD